jgi:lantibiotic modifying enzyme
VYEMKDIIGGESGIGLALLEMHRLTKDERYRAAAEEAGRWLLLQARRDKAGTKWETFGALDPNFSHGNAGIAFFLAALRDPGARKAGDEGAAWVESVAEAAEKGIYWRYYAGDPPEGRANSTMHSWCHGAPGTAGLFLALHRAGRPGENLDVAKKACDGLASQMGMGKGAPLFANPTLCCGAAGCLDAFTSVYAGG